MKKSFINKTVKAFLLAGALLAFISCKNGLEPVKNRSGVTISLKVHSIDEYKAQGQGNVAAQERTVNPFIDLDELSNFVLSGAKTGDSLKELTSFATIDDIPDSVEIPFEATEEEWTFVLYAEKGNSAVSGSTKAQLSDGNNELDFVLSLNGLAQGYASFAVTVDYSSAANCDKITKAEVFIEYADTNPVEGYASRTNPAVITLPGSNGYNFTYALENLPASEYRLVIQLYREDMALGYWQDLINLSDSLTSLANVSINKLNKAYKVTYNLYASGEAQDSSLSFDPLYLLTEKDTELPEPARNNYVFMGWFTDSAYTNPVVLPLTADTSLYAKWQDLTPPADGSYYPATAATVASVIASVAAGTETEPALIKVFGPIDEATISTICSAITSNNSYYYSIDLTGTRGLTALPNYSFIDCENLAEIKLPDGLKTIGYEAFFNCDSLKEVQLPETLETIGYEAFFGCNSLIEVQLPETLETIGKSAFSSCFKLEEIIIPDNVRSIGESAFSYCNKLEEIIIPDSVKSIGDRAFDGCLKLNSVSIGSGLESLGSNVFDGTSVTSLTVSGSNAYFTATDNILYTKDGKTLLWYSGGLTAESFVVPSSVECLAPYSFYAADNLKEITIADSVTDIQNAFRGCANLESIHFGLGLESISPKDFDGCQSIKTISIADNNPNYYVASDGVLYTSDSSRIVLYPCGSANTSYTVPANVTHIESGVFKYANNLTEVVFPNDGGAWYSAYDAYYDDPVSAIIAGAEYVDVSNSGSNAGFINSTDNNLMKFPNYESTMSALYANAIEITLYDSENTTFDDSFLYDYTLENDISFYKVSTEPGSLVTVNFIDSRTYGNFTFPNGVPLLDDCMIVLLSPDGKIIRREDDSNTLEFIATSSEVYIGIYQCYGEEGYYCAFRVWSQSVESGVSVELASDPEPELIQETSEGGGSYIFSVNGAYDSYAWFVDGKLKIKKSTYEYYFGSNQGLHTLTLEVTKDGKTYSVSKQIYAPYSSGGMHI